MSSTLIGWLITIGFVVVLAAGFFIGMWRGLKRSTVNLVISLVGLIIAIFITPPITKAILGIGVVVDGENSTLQALIVEMLRQDKDINAMMIANKNLEIFFTNLPMALINVVVLIVVTLAIELVLYVIYKILALTCFRIKEEEKKRSLYGGLVGLAKTFIIAVIAFMPLASLSGVANNLMVQDNYGLVYSQESQSEGNSLIEDKLPKNVQNILVGLENNLLTKICGITGLDNSMFDYYSNFEVDGEKLYVREEVENLYKIVDFTYQVSKIDLKEINFIKVRYDKVLKAVEDTTNSTLFKKVVANTLADMLINTDDYSFLSDLQIVKDYPEVFQNIKATLSKHVENDTAYQYFQNDLMKAINSVKSIGQNGIIDEIIDMEDASIEEIASVLTNSKNENALKNAITSIMDVNIVRAGIDTIVQKGLDAVSDELEKIDVSTSTWTEEAWDDFTTSVINIINDFGDISGEINVFDVMEDPTVLLDESKNYDINLIVTKLGTMLDEIRANNLLKTSEGESVIDGLLEKNNIILPENPVKDHNGNYDVVIDSYSDYFNFIKNSLVKLRDKGVYEIINDSSLTTKERIENLANILSVSGNEGLLSDIILPLYQVEPTKTIIIDELTNSLQSDLVNFASLLSYDEWKNDLGYLSTMLITLNQLNDGTNSYLSLALDGNINAIMDNLTESNVDRVLKPILYAKSTNTIKNDLFANIKSQLDNASGKDSTLSLVGTTLKEGETEDQTTEICEIVKDLLLVDEALDGGATLKAVDKTILGTLLNTMKANAYRIELSQKSEKGVFANAFVDLVNKFKSEYQTEIDYISTQQQILTELGISSFEESEYKKINYVQLLNKIAEIESLN